METLCSMVVESFWLASAARTTIFTEMLVNGFPAGNGSISCCEPAAELLLSILTVKPLEQESASKVPSSTPQLPVCTDTTIRFSSPAYSSQSCEALLRATAGFTLVTVKSEPAVVVGREQMRSRCFVVIDNWVSRYLPSPPATQESLGVEIRSTVTDQLNLSPVCVGARCKILLQPEF